MFKTAIKFLNEQVIRGRLAQLPLAQQKAIAQVIDEDLLEVLRESKTKPPRVPVDTGFLMSSGYVQPTKIKGGKILADIGYTAAYAALLHDNLNGKPVNFRRPGAGPKWLETPLRAHDASRRAKMAVALGEAWSKTR